MGVPDSSIAESCFVSRSFPTLAQLERLSWNVVIEHSLSGLGASPSSLHFSSRFHHPDGSSHNHDASKNDMREPFSHFLHLINHRPVFPQGTLW
jgi:hypothetical protein